MKKRITIIAIFLLWTLSFVSGCRSLPRQDSDSFFGTPTSANSTYIKTGSLQVGTRTGMVR